jgi:hypothetical protein
MKSAQAEGLPALGAGMEGGRFAGRINVNGEIFAVVLPPKAASHHAASPWGGKLARLAGALSFFDGLANTKAMAKAGSKLAEWALDQKLHIPARDELELLYRAFKPTTQANWCYRGDNPSSVPVGYSYSQKAPARTGLKEFQSGGAEAFEPEYYWSSTQSAGYAEYAWYQGFSYGDQHYGLKSAKRRAVAVRRVKI